MKTPREILFQRHQSATPKLDTIRQGIVAQINQESPKPDPIGFNFVVWCLGGLKTLWRELIFPLRPFWAGLAAVWLLILAANISVNSHSQIQMAKSSSEREMVQNVRQQEQLLTELIGPVETSAAEPQKAYAPRPSSQRFINILTV